MVMDTDLSSAPVPALSGADHVCVQVLGAMPGDVPMDALRAIAEALAL